MAASTRLLLYLFELELRRARAIFRHDEITLHPVRADLVGMRAVAAAGEHAVFLYRFVELGMVESRTVAPVSFALAAMWRCESMYVCMFLMLHSGSLYHRRPARSRRNRRRSTGLPRSSTWNVNEIVPSVWPGVNHIVTVDSPSVIFMPSVATMSRFGAMLVKRFGTFSTRSQSGPRHHDARIVARLDHLGAADVVLMGMRDDQVLDVLRIEPELLHAADDELFGVVRIDRVDQDDAFARRQRPCGWTLPPTK